MLVHIDDEELYVLKKALKNISIMEINDMDEERGRPVGYHLDIYHSVCCKVDMLKD